MATGADPIRERRPPCRRTPPAAAASRPLRGIRFTASLLCLPLALWLGAPARAQDARAQHQQANRLLNQAISAASSDPRTRGYANQLRSLQGQMNTAFGHYYSSLQPPYPAMTPYHAPAAGARPASPFQPLPSVMPAGGGRPPVTSASTHLGMTPPSPSPLSTPPEPGDPLSQSVLNTGSSLETDVLRPEPSPAADEPQTAFPVDDSGAVAYSGAGLSFGTSPAAATAAPAGDEWSRLLADTDQTLRQTDDWLADARQDPAMREAVAAIDQARQALRDAQQLLARQPLASPGGRPVLQGDLPDLYGTRQWLLAGGYADRSVFGPFHAVPATGATPTTPANTAAAPLVIGPVAFAAGTGPSSRRQTGNSPWNDPNVVDLRNAATLVPTIPGGTGGGKLPAPGTPPPAPSATRTPDGPGNPPAASDGDSTPSSRFGPILTPRLSPENREVLNLLTEYIKAGAEAGLSQEKAKELLDDALAGGTGYLAATGHLKEKLETIVDLKEFWDADNEGRAKTVISKGWSEITGALPTAGFTHAIVAKSYATITEKVLDNLQNRLDDFSAANGMPGVNLREGFTDSLTPAQRIVMGVLDLDAIFADKQSAGDREK